ncbi:MAG: lysylphosphatidylglycerol synthase transmembrane domain-containing protein [Thermoleophilia bacterium]
MPPARARRLVAVLLSAAMIGGLVWVSDWDALGRALRGGGPGLVLVAAGLYLANGVLKAYRWWLLLGAAGVRESPLRAYRAFLTGMAVNNLLPTGFAGEPVRLARLESRITPDGIAATAADRALDVLALAVAAAVGIPLLAGLDPDTVPAVAAAAGLSLAAVVAAGGWIWRRGRLASLARSPGASAGAVLLTVLIQVNDPVRLMLLAAAYDLDLGFWRSVGIVAISTVGGTVAMLGGGAGMALSVGALLAAAGSPAESAAAVGLVFVATSVWLSFPLGALATLVGRRVPRAAEARWT